ncbi:MAG: von Willebrand factor type domain [Hydrocarboniphaga sp.]|uniref:vWA domain-containing protein n=1 Tax=Hydrocarboniphaga sp. TaxID=2033016 RepID=UPI002637AC49|nr:vWA domain-containing protein [Hydrocarboniphaga sp.]MDB5970966.1 von Willebrand factor type domain [Hydrocarboniphaga sp.]
MSTVNLNPFLKALYALTSARPEPAKPHQYRSPPKAKHSKRRYEIAMVGYGTQAFVISRHAGPHDPQLAQRVMSLPQRKCISGGSTNLTAGIRLGLKLLQERPSAEKTIVCLTDGHANEELAQLPAVVEQARRAGVTIHGLAMGRGFHGEQLGKITHPTGGKVMLINDLRQLGNALTEVGRTVVNQSRGRPAVMCLAIDYSGSMYEDAGGKTKLQQVSEAASHLVRWFANNHA